jgi:hypothetical protein
MNNLPGNQPTGNDSGRKGSHLVVGGDGQLYCELAASGIPEMEALWRGMPLVYFEAGGPVYLLLADAIDFHEDKEAFAKLRGRPYRHRMLLTLMRRRLAVHEAGRDVPPGS